MDACFPTTPSVTRPSDCKLLALRLLKVAAVGHQVDQGGSGAITVRSVAALSCCTGESLTLACQPRLRAPEANNPIWRVRERRADPG